MNCSQLWLNLTFFRPQKLLACLDLSICVLCLVLCLSDPSSAGIYQEDFTLLSAFVSNGRGSRIFLFHLKTCFYWKNEKCVGVVSSVWWFWFWKVHLLHSPHHLCALPGTCLQLRLCPVWWSYSVKLWLMEGIRCLTVTFHFTVFKGYLLIGGNAFLTGYNMTNNVPHAMAM